MEQGNLLQLMEQSDFTVGIALKRVVIAVEEQENTVQIC